jgi:ligand-binding sensor domain-containing protein
MHLDAHKRLWVASGSAGVSFWDKHHDKFINVAEREGNGVDQNALEKLRVSNVLSISSDSFGRVWVGTRTMGLFMLEFKNELLVSIRQIAIHGTTQYGVSSMARERDGSIWIGTISHGLWHLAPQQSMPTPTLFTNHKISALWVDNLDNLWIGTQFELFFASKEKKKPCLSFNINTAVFRNRQCLCGFFSAPMGRNKSWFILLGKDSNKY